MGPVSVAGILSGNGINATEDQLQRLARYVDLLVDWNSRVNLVSRANEDVWGSHIIHSLALLFLVDIPTGLRVMDIGTGGGLPGIPLAILRPDISFVLVDSVKKKIAAVDEMISELGLSNAKAISGRTEELKKRVDLCHSFDMTIARAVAPLHELVAWSRPFVRPSSQSLRILKTGESIPMPILLSMKGGDLVSEVETASRKTGTTSQVASISFPGIEETGLEEKKLVITHL